MIVLALQGSVRFNTRSNCPDGTCTGSTDRTSPAPGNVRQSAAAPQTASVARRRRQTILPSDSFHQHSNRIHLQGRLTSFTGMVTRSVTSCSLHDKKQRSNFLEAISIIAARRSSLAGAGLMIPMSAFVFLPLPTPILPDRGIPLVIFQIYPIDGSHLQRSSRHHRCAIRLPPRRS